MEVARTGEWVLAIDLSDALLGLITLDDSPNRGDCIGVSPADGERESKSLGAGGPFSAFSEVGCVRCRFVQVGRLP